MSALSIQADDKLRRGLGVAVTAAAHVLIIVLLLSNRTTMTIAAPPIMAHVISDAAVTQQSLELPQVRPVLTQPKFHMAQPDLESIESSTTSLQPVAANISAAAVSSQAATHQADITEPRFDADYLNNPAPAYPRVSRRQREQGVVLIRVYVSSNGLPEVIELKTSSGFALLDASALEAVRKWKFVPAQTGGRAVAAWVVVPIDFSLSV